jgi:hypothetical protein
VKTGESEGKTGSRVGQRGRAFRGLVLVFVLSFLSLAGVLLTVTALGGLGAWNGAQFVGLFGIVEAASGLSNIIVPNVWRLPVAEQQTSRRTPVRLAASAMLIPHWGGAARALAGIVLVAYAALEEGVGTATLGLVLLIPLFAVLMLLVAMLVARAGVARPDLDVLQFVVRWGGTERELQPISLGASVLQFLLSIVTIPVINVLSPGALYRPEVGPAPETLLVALGATLAVLAAVVIVWNDRIDYRAPPEQQREAERHA